MRGLVNIILVMLAMSACNSNGRTSITHTTPNIDTLLPKELAGNFSNQQEIKLDSTAIARFIKEHSHFIEFQKELYQFYRNRNYSMAWFDSTGMIEQANILYNRIIKMKEDGMNLDIPFYSDYVEIMESPESIERVEAELMQTSQYLHFAKKLLSGISEDESKALEWYIPRKKADYIKILQKILEGDTSSVNNQMFQQYDLLKLQLGKYHQIEKNGGWDTIHSSKKNLKYGDSGTAVVEIKKRLIKGGEFTSTDTSNLFNLELEYAVKKFQQSHGLKADGVVSRLTIFEMNISVKDRIEQIILNMERCRWLPRITNSSYLMVNIPQFRLYVYNEDSLAFSCKAVVGKETNRTAIFKGDMKYIVFSPYWNVPNNIMKKEVLPAIKKKSNYLSDNHMEWSGNIIRQLPGPWNALGGVKFVFPNGYDIYLHDTPSKMLFNESTRTFSHGCIRISEPKKLAMFLLSNQGQWTEEAIDSAMISRIEKFVPLKKPVPVYVVYLTAFVDSDGVLNFSKDVYSRDLQLKKMILN